MCLIGTNDMSLNNLPSHYLGLNLEAKCHHFFVCVLPSLIAFFCTECFSISLPPKGQSEFSLFLIASQLTRRSGLSEMLSQLGQIVSPNQTPGRYVSQLFQGFPFSLLDS